MNLITLFNANFNLVSSSDGGVRSHSPFTKLYDVVAMFVTHGFRKNKSEYLNVYTSRETKNSLNRCRSLLNAQKVNPKVIIFYVEIKSSSFSSVSINIASHISLCLYFILSSLLYFKSQQKFSATHLFSTHTSELSPPHIFLNFHCNFAYFFVPNKTHQFFIPTAVDWNFPGDGLRSNFNLS